MTELERQGIVLRDLRKQSNKTMQEVANLCGKAKSWISEIEHGRSRLYFDDAHRLCQIYGVTLQEFSKLIDEE